MSLLGRIFKSPDRGSSSNSDTREPRHVDTVEDQSARRHEPGQAKPEGSDFEKELERWAAEDDKDVKRR